MTCCANPAVYDYATEIAGRAQEQRIAELKASACIMEDGTAVYVVSVPDIHCGLCMAAIEDRLAKLDGVISSRVNLTLKRVTVVLDSRDRSPIDFRDAMEALGYKVLLLDSDSDHVTKLEFSNLVRALAVAGFASANIMLLSVSVWTGAAGATRELFHLISAMIAVPAIAYSGQPFFRSAVAALRGGRLNMDVPISLGVILALCMSLYEAFHGGRYAYFDAAVGLLFFLLIGRTLDQLMRAKSRLAVERLSKLSSRGAMRLGEDGKLVYVPIDEIVPAMVLRITAGERIPVDCVVLSGAGDVDRSLVTGESEPVSVMPGVSLEAGTLNLTDPIEIRVLRAASHSFLAEMLAMMNAAEHGRGVYDRIADRVARAYAPLVHVLAIASFLFWMYSTGGDWHTSLTIAIAVLIITCPCAIGLAVPVAHVISAERLFSAGILMKDGSALERLAKADYAVFDKTGTLTTGEPRLAASEIPQGSIGALAKALALRSSHPASKALARHLHDAVDVQLETVTEHPGQGMQARHNGKVLRLGRRAWVQEITKKAGKNSEFGLCFAIEDGSIYSVVLDEDLRPGAQEMLNSLLDARIACEMLTGDSQVNAARIALQLRSMPYRSSLSPVDKLHRVQSLAAEGRRVLVVGDGLNDAPALAAAHVSIAPASGSDVGRAAADFVFTRQSLDAITLAVHIAKRTDVIVRQNFALAIAYNVLAVPLAMAGVLNPLIAAVAMSSSSLLVVGNSLRLLKEGRGSAPIQPGLNLHLSKTRAEALT